MGVARKEIQRYLTLCVGTFGLLFCGNLNAFSIYAVAVKQTFEFTQSELEYITVSVTTGLELPGYFSGIVVDKYGPRFACILAAMLTWPCFVLMWMSMQFKTLFASWNLFMCLIYFIAASGCCCAHIAIIGTISINFEGKHRGKIVGFASAIYGSSSLIFAAIYQGIFVEGHITDEENQNLAGFFILLCILAGCTLSLCSVLLIRVPPVTPSIPHLEKKRYSTESSQDEEIMRMETNINKGKLMDDDDYNLTNAEDDTFDAKTPFIDRNLNTDKNTPEVGKDITDSTCFQMIKTLKFHYFLWIVIILKGIGLTFSTNVTIVAKSALLETASLPLLMTGSISNTLARFLGGCIPDILKQKFPFVPTSSLLLFASFLMMSGQILLIFFNQSLIGLVSCSVMHSVANGLTSVMVMIGIAELFGSTELSQKIGLVLSLGGICAFPFAKLFAWIYENNSPQGSTNCVGVHCSRGAYAIMAVFALVSALLSSALAKAEHNQKSQNQT
ncbi:unnamed protein product [Owenia fusiformis]|uniref:Uncharacterized protein n=1 Tax=Owenia fusiformis TaxID=6347 RepID=A0A8J1UPX2_OWEFU|nr:unnamed protein product [Owenia fusiformis]